MGEQDTKMSALDRLREWVYEQCLGYCVRFAFPDADPTEFSFLDNANFVAISKDEIQELIEEAPEIAWHFVNPETGQAWAGGGNGEDK